MNRPVAGASHGVAAIGHLALTVSDLDASTTWCNRVFDTEPAFAMSFDDLAGRSTSFPGARSSASPGTRATARPV